MTEWQNLNFELFLVFVMLTLERLLVIMQEKKRQKRWSINLFIYP